MKYSYEQLMAIGSQTSQTYDQEGVLLVQERHDGFFQTSKVYSTKWFRLRGTLLFYLRGIEPCHKPAGVILLGSHQLSVLPRDENGEFPFQIEWQNGFSYRLAAFHETERLLWLKTLQAITFQTVCMKMDDSVHNLDIVTPVTNPKNLGIKNCIITDFNVVPICEMVLSCDDLLCDSQGNPPSTFLVVFLLGPGGKCVRYASTEILDSCRNPSFCRTIQFRASDLITAETTLRIAVYDIKESVTNTSVEMGAAILKLNVLQEAQCLRIPLESSDKKSVGFVTINGWSFESAQVVSLTQTNTECSSVEVTPKVQSQGCPASILGRKLKYPLYEEQICSSFSNSCLVSYRLRSGLGGVITMHEVMAEFKFGVTFPLQLLEIYTSHERERLDMMLNLTDIEREMAPQKELFVTTHLYALKSAAACQKAMRQMTEYYKPSNRKQVAELCYLPVNLHLQRMWAHNDTLNKAGFHDIVTVGAFTVHHTRRTEADGGLIQMLNNFQGGSSITGDMTANADRLNAELEKIFSAKLIRDAAIACMENVLRALNENDYSQMVYLHYRMIINIKKHLSLWNSEVNSKALTNVGWSSIKSGNSVTRPMNFKLSTQLKVRPPIPLPAGGCAGASVSEPAEPESSTSSQNSGSASTPSDVTDTDTSLEAYWTETGTMDYAGALPSAESTTDIAMTSASVPDTSNRAKQETELLFHSDHSKREPHNKKRSHRNPKVSHRNKNRSFRSAHEPKSDDTAGKSYRRRCTASLEQMFFKSLKIKEMKDKSVFLVLDSPPKIKIDKNVQNANERFIADITLKSIRMGMILEDMIDSMICKGFHTDKEYLEAKQQMENVITQFDQVYKLMRLGHAAMRLLSESPTWTTEYTALQGRRDCCFIQALTALVSGLVCWLNTAPAEVIHKLVTFGLGPLCCFEGLLSLHALEKIMWSDMVVAIEDLHSVAFKLVKMTPGDVAPQVTGSRNALVVKLPVSDTILAKFDNKKEITTFTVTAVFFNMGINEKATVAEQQGEARAQHYSNSDGLERLTTYYNMYTGLFPNDPKQLMKGSSRSPTLEEVMETLRSIVQKRAGINVELLHMAALATRLMHGVRFTSCKSAKDRTGMATTLEQSTILSTEYNLAEPDQRKALDVMRSVGTRMDNTCKNTGVSKYAFSKRQVSALPENYRPPQGTYGTNDD